MGRRPVSDLRAKDIITKFDGYSVRTMEDLQNLLQRYRQGETVELTVQRLENGEYTEKTVSIVLGAKAEVGRARKPRNRQREYGSERKGHKRLRLRKRAGGQI